MLTIDRDGVFDANTFASLAARHDLMVLDVHGVVLNRPLHGFLDDVAQRIGERPAELQARWRSDIRLPFWTGAIDEATMWHELAPACDAASLRADLERRFAAGPLYDAVLAHDGPVWLLSNHRASWLGERLDRFGLGGRFERVFVSDEIGAAKPSGRAFACVAAAAAGLRVCYVDDQQHNVDAATSAGFAGARVDGLLSDP